MGLLPEMARRQPVGTQPTSDAFGCRRRTSPRSWLQRIIAIPIPVACDPRSVVPGGVIIGLGYVDVLTLVHCAEDMGRVAFPVDTHRKQLYEGRVRSATGHEHTVSTRVAHPRIRWRSMRAFFQRHISDEVCRRFEVAGRSFYRADAGALLDQMERLAERGITMYRNGIYRGHF